MKNKAKLLVSLIAASLFVTSCGGNKTPSSSSSSISSSSSSSSIAPKTYTVTWKNSDGTVLETDTNVLEGSTPTYEGENPTKNNDAQYNYVFSGWTPEITAIHADAEYTATYREELRKYSVVWKDADGTVLETDNNVPYGTMPEFNGLEPTKDQTVESTFSFAGWTPEVANVEGDATYTATYDANPRNYTITWKNYDDNVIKTETIPYGTLPTYEGDTPIRENTAQTAYSFAGWSPNIKEVEGDATYVATFSEETRSYKVTWLNDDGSVLKVDEVLYGSTPSYGEENPTKPNKRGVTYYFQGWTPEIAPVQGEQTYVATYSYDCTFSFERINYELQSGHNASEIQGSPWINSNIDNQLKVIKKPSLKDDFYASINYEDIRNHVAGPFRQNDSIIDKALNNVYNNAVPTTNGAIVNAILRLSRAGDAEGISNYLNSIDLDTYLNTRAIFSSPSSLLQIASHEDGYEVQFNSGYYGTGGNLGLHTMWFYSKYYPEYDTATKNIFDYLSNALNLDLTETKRNKVASMEKNLTDKVYNSKLAGFRSYTVDTVPWAPVKAALLDLGLPSDKTIVVKKCVIGSMDTLFNTYASSLPGVLKDTVVARHAFDYRMFMGLSKYRELNAYLSQLGEFFTDEKGLANYNDDQLCKAITDISVPVLIEQAYLDQEGSPEKKAKVISVIQNVLEGYEAILDDADWLSDSTKNNVKTKLEMMKFGACYPDEYKNFVRVDQTNIQNASIVDVYRAYYNGLVDTTLINQINTDPIWTHMTTYTNNAFYSPDYNEFVILNGIVSGMISDRPEELYGMLGCVIGHEITHAFDSTGSHYDEYGARREIFTSDDRAAFSAKVNKVVDFFNNITLFNAEKADGNNVDGEATADLGGMRVMLKLAESIPDFDYDLFFRTYAKVWLVVPSNMWSAYSRAKDSHPFNYLRVNVTVCQYEKFYETYDIQPGDGMYVPEEERIAIW